MNKIIIGIIVSAIVLTGGVGFVAYSLQDENKTDITKQSIPCLDLWNNLNQNGKLTSGQEIPLDDGEEESYKKYIDNNCHENLDWLPKNHADYEYIKEVRKAVGLEMP